jgi:hypothetical protein
MKRQFRLSLTNGNKCIMDPNKKTTVKTHHYTHNYLLSFRHIIRMNLCVGLLPEFFAGSLISSDFINP